MLAAVAIKGFALLKLNHVLMWKIPCVQYKQTANYLLLAILACKAHYSIMSVGSLSSVHFHIVLPTLAVA